MQNRPTILALLALLVFALAADALRLEGHSRYQAAQRYEDVYYLPPAGSLRFFSLGYDEALADLIWMRSLIYFGEEFEHRGDVAHVFDYATAMTTLDPRFRAVYRWVGTAGIYRPNSVSPDDIRRSADFMIRGARLFPDDGQLAWDIGAAYIYELSPILDDPEAKDAARERGIPYLMSAVRLGAAPEWASLSNAAVLERLGQNDQAARHLEEMYANTSSPSVRAQIAERLRQLRERAQAEAFLATMEELEADRRRDFPYAPASLYLLLGPRPPLDLDRPIQEGFPAAFGGPEAP